MGMSRRGRDSSGGGLTRLAGNRPSADPLRVRELPVPAETQVTAHRLLLEGSSVQALKEIRATTYYSLQDAVDVAFALLQGMPVPTAAGVVPERPDPVPLELRAGHATRRLAFPLVIPFLLTLQLFVSPTMFNVVVGAVGGGAVALIAGVMLIAGRNLRALGGLLRIDADGITVQGSPTVPWTGLGELRWVQRGPKLPPVLVFVPGPGTVLPALPSGMLDRFRAASRRAALVKRYGSPLVVMPTLFGTTAVGIVAAVQRCSELPVKQG